MGGREGKFVMVAAIALTVEIVGNYGNIHARNGSELFMTRGDEKEAVCKFPRMQMRDSSTWRHIGNPPTLSSTYLTPPLLLLLLLFLLLLLLLLLFPIFSSL